MKANKKPKNLRSALPTETAAPAPASPAPVSMAPESASVTTTQPDAAVDANLPPDVVSWPKVTTGSEVAARVRQASNSLTPEQRESLLAEGMKAVNSGEPLEADLTRQAESPAATAQLPKENVVATPKRTPGAGWFIPPPGPSQFGVKKG